MRHPDSHIDAAIKLREQELADAERRVEQLRAELATLIRAAEIMTGMVGAASSLTMVARSALPAPMMSSVTEPLPRRGRKPVGAISRSWRLLLGAMAELGHPFSLEELQHTAKLGGLEMSPQSIRDRVRRYTAQGLLEQVERGRYQVTDKAPKEKPEMPTAPEGAVG